MAAKWKMKGDGWKKCEGLAVFSLIVLVINGTYHFTPPPSTTHRM